MNLSFRFKLHSVRFTRPIKKFVQKNVRREYDLIPSAIFDDPEKRLIFCQIIFPVYFDDRYAKIAYVKEIPPQEDAEGSTLKMIKQTYRYLLWNYILKDFLPNSDFDEFRERGVFPNKEDLFDGVYATFCATDVMLAYFYYLKFVKKDLKDVKLFHDERSLLSWDEDFKPFGFTE